MADDDFQRILVIATRQIGDVLLSAPLIDAAQRRWPGARIDVLGFAGTLGMLRRDAIGEVIEVPPGSGWRHALSMLRRLWRRYDLALITQQSDRAHLYGWAAARVRSGLLPNRTSIAWWKRRLLRHAVTVDDERTPTVVEKLRLLEPWTALPERIDVAPPSAAPLPPEIEAQLSDRPVVVHVPSMWVYKQWPTRHFAVLIKALLRAGHQVVLTGSASATDQAQIAQVRALSAPALLDVSGRLDLRQVTTLLRRAALYVGPDTSITHLAAACGTPMVTVFGPTNPVRWGPWPQGSAPEAAWQRAAPRQAAGRVIMMQADQPCIACGHAGCEDHRDSRSQCLEALLPEPVIAECLAILGAQRAQQES
jgi:heptosyltransferase-3